MTTLSERLARLSPEQRAALLKQLRQQPGMAEPQQERIARAPRDAAAYPVTPAQQRMWLFQQMGENAAYNMCSAIRIEGALDRAALEQALFALQERHESLRTTFAMDGLTLTQRIAAPARQPLETVDLSTLPPEARDAEVASRTRALAARVFDLERGPLFEVGLLRLEEDHHVLLANMHHIISDGWSMTVLIGELSRLYQAFAEGGSSPLEPLAVQYLDYTLWQRDRLTSEVVDGQLRYWRRAMRDAPPLLDLAGDRDRPAVKTFRAATEFFVLGEGLAAEVAQYARSLGATPFIVLAAAVKVLLVAWSGQSDIVLATPVANRNRRELEGVIGFFANTLLLRDRIDRDETFSALAARVKASTLEAYSYQDVPYDQVVEALNPPRSTAHAPLAQVMFVVQNVPDGSLDLGGLRLSPIEIGREGSDFDLILELQPKDGGYHGILTYSTDLFDAASMHALIAQYGTLLQTLLAEPQSRIASALARLAPPAWRMPAPAVAPPAGGTGHPSWHESIALRAAGDVRIGDGATERPLEAVLTDAGALGARLALLAVPGKSVAIALRDPADGALALLACWHAGLVPCLLDADASDAALDAQAAEAGVILLLADAARPLPGVPKQMTWADARDAIGNGSMIPAWRPNPSMPALRIAGDDGVADASHASFRRAIDAQARTLPLSDQEAVLLLRAPVGAGFARDLLWALHGARRIGFAGDAAAVSAQWATTHLVVADAGHLSALAASPASPALRTLALVDGEVAEEQVAHWFSAHRAELVQSHTVAAAPDAVLCARRGTDGAVHWNAWTAGFSVRQDDGSLCPDGMQGRLHLAATGHDGAPVHRDTGHRARRGPGGELRLLACETGADPRRIWRAGVRGGLDSIEAWLRRQPMAKDAVVIKYAGRSGVRLVAYVASARAEALHAMRDAAAEALPRALRPDLWVPVSAIPLAADGAVDTAALKACIALDADDLARLEAELGGQPGVQRAAIAVRELQPAVGRHHLADAIPGWRRSAVAAAEREAAVETMPDDAPGDDTPALAVGQPLPDDLPANLGALLRRAADGPHGVHYVDRDGVERHHTYAELLALAERILGGLRAQGVVPGDIVVFQLPENPEFVPAFWACALGGFVPVPLAAAPTYAARNAALDKLLNTCRLLEPAAVIAGSGLEREIESALRSQAITGPRVLALRALRDAGRDAAHHPSQPDDLALLLLTSGSTGMPKAVRQSHRALVARCAATAIHNGFADGEVSLNWMPLDHVGGLVMYHMLDVYLGGRQIQVATDHILQNPLRWMALIDQYRASVTWAPNFAYALVNERLDQANPDQANPDQANPGQAGGAGWDLSCMRFVLNGGEAIVSKTARTFLRGLARFGLPGDCMRPSWGMSETCSGVVFSCLTLDNSSDEDPFVEVGAPIPGVSIRIVDAEDRIVGQGRTGRLQIRGPSITSGYLRNEDATREAFTADGWFNTGDLAVLHGDRLSITGREKDVIIVNGLNYYSHEIERVVDDTALAQASFTAATAIREPGTETDKLAVFFVAADPSQAEAAIRGIRNAVLAQCQINPAYLVPLAPDDVPKTSIGKIQRSQLGTELLAGRFDALLREQDLLAGNANTVPAWFFRRTWQPAKLRGAGALRAAHALAFVRDEADAQALCAAGGAWERIVRVEAGEDFALLAPDHYRVDPAEPADFDRLFAALADAGVEPEHIAWFWAMPWAGTAANADIATLETARQAMLQPLLGLLKTLSRLDPARERRLAIASGGLPGDLDGGEDRVLAALLPGLLKTAALEMAHVAPIVVHSTGTAPAHVASALLAELSAPGRDVEVVHREGRRLLPRLLECDVSAAAPHPHPLPLKRGGLYLVTGGLGGIGRQLVQRLVRDHAARVLIVGRSAVDGSAVDGEGVAAEGKATERAAAFAALVKTCGADSLRYVRLDIADADALAAAVADAETRCGRHLDGIFHLAGEGNLAYHWTVADRHTIANETPAMFDTMMRPKVRGMVAVGALLRTRPEALLVAFSSVNALYGGATFSAYSSANGFVSAYAQHLRRRYRHVYAIDWTMWDDVGMSRDNPAYARDASRTMGYRIVSVGDGWASMCALLCRAPDRYVVGLDAGNRHIRPDLVDARPQREALAAYVELAPGQRQFAGDAEFRDTLGHRHRFDLTVCETLPTREDGTIDRDALAGLAGAAGERGDDRAAPRNEAETVLLQVWKQILGLERVGIHDNFFELGGDSVLSTQVVARANQLGMRLTSKQLFERQTIAELAEVAAVASETRIDAEQGMVQGDCALAPIQAWFFEQGFAAPAHWNQSLLLRIGADRVDAAALRAALSALVAHHDALRLAYRQEADGWHQHHLADVAVALDLFDLSASSAADARAAMEAEAARLQGSLDLETGLRLRAALFDLGAEGHRLLLVVHHLVTDGVSWRILLEDLTALYRAASEGRALTLPSKTSAYRAWTARLRDWAASDTARAQAAYWRTLAPAPLPVPVLGGGNLKTSETLLEVELDADATRALLRDVPAAYRSEINDALLTALLLSARTLCGQDRLLLAMEGHGREDLFEDIDVSRTVGWFTSLYPLSLRLPEREDIGDCLKSVKEQLRAVPGRGIAYGAVRHAGGDAALARVPQPAMSFNYLGQFDQVMSAGALFDLATEHPGPMHAAHERRSNALDIVAFVREGRLKIAFAFASAHLDAAAVEVWAQAYIDALHALIAHCAEPAHCGFTPSDVPLLQRDQSQLDALMREVALRVDPRRIETLYPATPVQRGLIYHSMLAPGEGVYVSHLMNEIRGRLDVDALRQAWEDTVARHEIYRAMLADVGGTEPVLVVLRSVDLPWTALDWADLDTDTQEARYRALLAEDRARGFEFERAPLLRLYLIRLADDRYRFVLSEHHAVSDGWSRSLVLREVLGRYLARVRGETPKLPEPRRFRDYVAWLRAQDREAMAGYWREALADLAPRSPLSIGRAGTGDGHGHTTAAARFALGEAQTRALLQFARREQLTPSVLVQGAWAMLLARYGGEHDVVFGSTVSGRPTDLAGADDTVGPFINSLPVRVRIERGRPLADWLRDLHAAQVGREAYGHCALSDILAWSAAPTGTALFESVLVYENYPAVGSEPGEGLRIDWADAADQTELPLTLMVEPGERMSFCLYHDAGRYEGATVERLLRHLGRLLESMAEGRAVTVEQLEMLTAEEHAEIAAWNATETDLGPADAMLHTLFSAQVARTPDAVAVIAGDTVLTYADVHRRAMALSERLRALGAGPNRHVALVLGKGWEQIVAVYAVLYAGGAYLPIDPAWPEDRRRYLIGHGEAVAVLTTTALEATFAWSEDVPRLAVDAISAAVDHDLPLPPVPRVLQAAGDLAYTIFTSGSTGLPKGVMIDHRGAVNTVRDINARFGVTAADRVLAVSSLTFDLSVYDIFGPLAIGGAVVMPDDEQAKDPAAWTRLIETHGVTLWDTVPALLQMLVDHLEREARTLPQTLRLAMLSGDWIPLSLPDRYRACFPGSRIVSMGGATEASIWSILYPIGEVDPSWASIPYGKALANQRFYVLNEHHEPCPVGVRGDLFIGGIGLALGYWRDEEKTARSFVLNPRTGERLYRTGDLGRYLPDGNIEFLGRADFQVKVNGYRIELGEIEAALLRHEAVSDAIALVREDVPGERRLVAYLRTDAEALPAAELRGFLKSSLPDYMVPWHFVCMAQFPLSSNGKVDRKQLPAPEDSADHDIAVGAATTPTEELLLRIWSDVLGTEVADTGLNFFELGGHSLLTAQVIVRAREAFGVELPIRALFDAPTVAALARTIEDRLHAGGERLPAFVAGGDDAGALSFAQRRLWFLSRLEGESATYNITTALRIEGPLDAARMQRSLAAMVVRHDALRTRFVDREGVPERIVDAAVDVRLQMLDADEQQLEALAVAEARAPFDLARGPLFRFTLVDLGDQRRVLLSSIHHIVADGWSVALFLRELSLLYRHDVAGALSTPPYRYADYVVWERAFLEGEALDRQLDYWKRRLAGMPALLPLATDLPRPPVQSYRGATRNFSIGPDLAARIRAQCARHGVTLYMYLLAALDVTLAHASGQRDIAVGATVANRSVRELEGIFGLFANQVVMRSDLGGEPRFAELLRRVRQTALEAYAHQEAPFDRVVEALAAERSLAYTPLFQVKLVLQNVPLDQEALPGLCVDTLGVDPGASKFDLQYTIEESQDGLSGSLTYNTDIFLPSTAARLLAALERVLEEASADPERPVEALIADLASLERVERERRAEGLAEASLGKLRQRRRVAVVTQGEHTDE